MVQTDQIFIICVAIVLVSMVMKPYPPPVPVAPIAPVEYVPVQRGPAPFPLAIGNCSMTILEETDLDPRRSILVCSIPGINGTLETLESLKSIQINGYAVIPPQPLDLAEQRKYIVLFVLWSAVICAIMFGCAYGMTFLVRDCRCCPGAHRHVRRHRAPGAGAASDSDSE